MRLTLSADSRRRQARQPHTPGLGIAVLIADHWHVYLAINHHGILSVQPIAVV